MRYVIGTAPRLSTEALITQTRVKDAADSGRWKGASSVFLTTLVGGIVVHFAAGKDKAQWGYLGGAFGGLAYQYAKLSNYI